MSTRSSLWSSLIGFIILGGVSARLFAQATDAGDIAELETRAASGIDVAERLSADQVLKDIEQFRQLAKEQWMLAHANNADLDGAINALKRRAVNGMTKEELILELQKVIALGIDGHAEVSGFLGLWNGQAVRRGEKSHETSQLPFLIDLCGDNYVAYVHDKSPGDFVNAKRKYRYRLLDDRFPHVQAIDGVPIETWVKCARQFVPKGPERAVRWRCVQILNGLRFMRGELGLELRDHVSVTLLSDDLSQTTEKNLPVANLYSFHLKKPRPDWKLLDDNIGYIWLRTGAAPGMEALIAGMSHFRNTKGLVIDCRDNVGHGPPETSLFLGSFLLPDNTPRKIVGTVLQHKTTGNGEACVYPGMSGLSEDDEAAIRSFQSRYRPELAPRDGQDVWNYVMLPNTRRSEAKWGMFEQADVRKFFADEVYHYEQPVVILTNHRTFSAGEMFVACMQELPNVTVVGTPTAASVVNPRVDTLTESGLKVLWGQRVFQRKNGRLVDGRGIDPDVLVEIDTDYYRSTRDATLEKAIEILNQKTAANKPGQN